MQTTQFELPPGFIDLGLGDPQFSLLPLELIHRAAEERLSQKDREFLQYGSTQGDGTFRQSLANFLSRAYGLHADPRSIFITSGASMGLHLICTLFTSPGDTIFIEEPTYFYALRIFADHHLHLVPIQTDQDGLMIGSLEEQLSRFHPKLLYLIPTFQNPTGQTLPAERRKRLAELCQKNDILLVADEVYHLLSFSGQPPEPFAAQVDTGNIISLGSFSKILAPGLRLGWLQASGEIIQRCMTCGLLESGGGLNPFTSAIVNRVIESNALEQNIVKLISIYRDRAAVMESLLRQHLPGCDFTPPLGGYFYWLRLPEGVTADALQLRAQDLKVGFRPGRLFSSQGGMENFIRLSYVFYEPDKLELGVLRIKQCLESSA